jgi:hypothetical protein
MYFITEKKKNQHIPLRNAFRALLFRRNFIDKSSTVYYTSSIAGRTSRRVGVAALAAKTLL